MLDSQLAVEGLILGLHPRGQRAHAEGAGALRGQLAFVLETLQVGCNRAAERSIETADVARRDGGDVETGVPPAVIAGAGFGGVADVGFAGGCDCVDYVDFFGDFRWGGGHFAWIRVGAASCRSPCTNSLLRPVGLLFLVLWLYSFEHQKLSGELLSIGGCETVKFGSSTLIPLLNDINGERI